MPVPAPPSTATASIRRVWNEVYERWPNTASLGVSCCRRIGADACNPALPGGDWSQHAWSNAWDIDHTTLTLDKIAAFLRSATMAPYVAEVLWRVPDHYGHIHVSGRPKRTGVPPCAVGVVGGGVTTPSELAQPLPAQLQLVGGETWAPALRVSSWQLIRSADRVVRIAGRIGPMMRRG